MSETAQRVDVVLDVIRDGEDWRVVVTEVLSPDQPDPARPNGAHDAVEHYRNRVQTWINVPHSVRAFRIPANDAAYEEEP